MTDDNERILRDELARSSRATIQAPIDMQKIAKRYSWINWLVGGIIAASGALTAFVATRERSSANEERSKANSEAVTQNRTDIKGIKSQITDAADKITDAAAGVKRLEAEIQTSRERRLSDKIELLQKENTRLERARR